MPPSKRPPPKKKGKLNSAAAPPPDTADDFLAAAVALEESAEKHRAGDTAKAGRFYASALDAYAAGLARHPHSFDLRYNLARARLALASNPRLAAAAGGARALLEQALGEHDAAAALRPEQPDVLFNGAQVRAALADDIEAEAAEDGGALQVLALREEAAAGLVRCFVVQEGLYAAREDEVRRGEAMLAAQQAEDGVPGGVGLDTSQSTDENRENGEGEREDEGQWALIEEPVTIQSLLDTSVALADVLAAACRTAADLRLPDKLRGIEATASEALERKAQAYVERAPREDRIELCVARAKTKCALTDAAYTLSLVDLAAYEAAVAAAFGNSPELIDADDPRWLCVHAECLIELADTAAEKATSVSKRWSFLDSALGLLAAASKVAKEAAELSSIHTTRGDVEFLRLVLSMQSEAPDALRGDTVRRTLVQNAQKFYRGAKNCVQGDLTGAGQQALLTAQVKEAVALAVERGSSEVVNSLSGPNVTASAVRAIIAEMVDDQILTEDLANSAGLGSL